MTWTEEDRHSLAEAKDLLENPSIAARIASYVGKPVELGYKLLPSGFGEVVNTAARKSLQGALECALGTMGGGGRCAPSNFFHKALVAATGTAGGAVGLAALPVELPITTVVMLRSIADIARSEGESLRQTEARLACLEVFALGGTSPGDDSAEAGYFAVRAALAKTIAEAGAYIAEKGLAAEGAPALVRLIANIAARFGVVVTEKAAAQAIPILGAAGGALVNTLFMDHYQDMARGHFTVRRLERAHGVGAVRREWERV